MSWNGPSDASLFPTSAFHCHHVPRWGNRHKGLQVSGNRVLDCTTGAYVKGESGPEEKETVQSLMGSFSEEPNLKFIFPTARPIRFSPFPWNGQVINSWYDIDGFRQNAVENTSQMKASAQELMRLVQEQKELGLSPKRICIVGFSRGGSMALHLGYEYFRNVGCVGVLSSWLPASSQLEQKLLNTSKDAGVKMPPLYLSIGTMDPLVRTSWVEGTARVFRSAGVPTSMKVMSGTSHRLTRSALQGLFTFIRHSVT